MKIEIDVNENLLMKYNRLLCGEDTCVGCDEYSELKGCTCRYVRSSLEDSIEKLLEYACD